MTEWRKNYHPKLLWSNFVLIRQTITVFNESVDAISLRKIFFSV